MHMTCTFHVGPGSRAGSWPLGGGSPKRLYKAPKNNTKPQQTMQSPDRKVICTYVCMKMYMYTYVHSYNIEIYIYIYIYMQNMYVVKYIYIYIHIYLLIC